MTGLGFVAQAQGDYDAALEWYEKSLAIKEKHTGPGSDATAGVQHSIASVHLARRQWGPCVEAATVSWEGYAKSAPHSMWTAAAGAVLARCRWEGGERDDAVLQLARTSRDDLRAAGAGAAEDLAEIEAWLKRRG
jgi:hypothetical protein